MNGQQVGPPPEVAKEEDKAEVEVGEKPATGRQRLYKSLDSDPDDWKLRNLEPVPRELSEVKLVQADGLENNAGAGEDFQPSPEGLKKHRQLVQEQLQQLPKEIGSATTLAADEGLTSLESTFGRRLAPEAPEFVPGAAITPAGQEDYNTMAGMPPLEEDPWAPCYRAREF